MNDFTGYVGSNHVNGCDCLMCQQWNEHKARMKAATCRCGHVGAECFNDSYCEAKKPFYNVPLTPGKDTKDHIIEGWQKQYADMKKRAVMLQDELDVATAAHKATLDEYLAQFAGWEKLYHDLSARIERAENEQATKIAELETNADSWHKAYLVAMELLVADRETIEDLQADYAEDMAWRDIEQGQDEAALRERNDRIDQLETTIKVLSGLLSNI